MTPKIKRAITELRRQELYVMLIRRSKGDEASKVADECERQEVEIERLRGLLANRVKEDWEMRIEQYKFRVGFGADHGEIAAMEMQRDEAVERILKGEV